jgi:hypothetical protein
MGKIETINILLDKPQGIYTAGELCTGKVSIRLNERLKINSFSMRFWGYADVHWTESRGSGKSRRTVHFRSHEDYIDVNTVFVGKKLDQDCYLEVGEYNYPFSVVIPVTCPTSFEHHYGRVRYILTGTVDIPWAFDKHVTRTITVLSPVDLNLIPGLKQPASLSQVKKFGCLCFESDPCEASFRVPKGGYVAGEVVNFEARVDNKGDRKIKMRVKLIQLVTLHASTKSRTWTQLLGSLNFTNEIGPKTFEDWRANIQIPAVCPSSNNTCRIINVSYVLQLELDPSGMAMTMSIPMPFCIGTLPLTDAPTNSRFSFEKFQTEATEQHEPVENEEEGLKGEVTNMDNNYFPSYPYFKDFSIKS